MDKKQKEFEEEKDKHIKYINEQYKSAGLELVRIKKHSGFKKFLGSFAIALGIIFFAVVIFYLGHYDDKFGFDLVCPSCGNNTLQCSEIPECPDMNCDITCPSVFCEFPGTLDINLINGSGGGFWG